MKRLFCMLIVLLLFCNAALAQQQEWVDKKYNFTEICYDVRRKRFNLHKSR